MKEHYEKMIGELDAVLCVVTKIEDRDPDKRRELKTKVDGLLDERLRLMRCRDSCL